MAEQLPKWDAVGVEPPTVLKTDGWQPGMKPSAQHMNWLFNRIYKCLEEIQLNGGTEEIQQELAALQELVTAHQAERATPTTLGHVKAETDEEGNLILPEMSASNVTTTGGSNVQTEIDNLKSSVSSGKIDVRNSITGKGGTVADADGDGVPSFAELQAGVQGLNVVNPEDAMLSTLSSAYSPYLTLFDSNDEADGICVATYINATAGRYEIWGYNRSGSPVFNTQSLGVTVQALARDDGHYYASYSGYIVKGTIVQSGYPSTVWSKIVPDSRTYSWLHHKNGKVYGLRNDGLTLDVIDAISGTILNTFVFVTNIGASGKIVVDDEGFIYAYVNNNYLYKLKQDGSIVWMVTGLTVSGSNPEFLGQSKNYVFPITSNYYISKINKATGAVEGTKNFLTINNHNRIAFDQYGNGFMWRKNIGNVSFMNGKESYASIRRTQNTNVGEFRGQKKPFILSNTDIVPADFYYKL